MNHVRVAATIACGAIAIAFATLPATATADQSSKHQAAVERRSEHVMPFDLNRTMHMFRPMPDGGVQTVMVHDGDTRQVALVRSHLKKEAAAFARGNFADPAAIHGASMPGLAQLRAGAKRIAITYADTPDGGEIVYKTHDPALVAAIHAWFAAQVKDHGAHAMMMR